MAGSALVAVKCSIVDNMRARLGDGWSVGYSWPGDVLAQGDVMWLGAASISVETTSLRTPRRRRTETVEQTIGFWATTIDAATTGDDRQLAADEKAIEAVRLLDEWIADEGHLGVPEIVDDAWFLGVSVEPGPTDRGEACLMTATVRYQARLL